MTPSCKWSLHVYVIATVRESKFAYQNTINHFAAKCLVAWPLNEAEAGVDLVLIETSRLFLCKSLLL